MSTLKNTEQNAIYIVKFGIELKKSDFQLQNEIIR